MGLWIKIIKTRTIKVIKGINITKEKKVKTIKKYLKEAKKIQTDEINKERIRNGVWNSIVEEQIALYKKQHIII